MRKAWLVLAAAVVGAPAAALQVLDDDAGSGHDAGGLDAPVPVAPGDHAGQLTSGLDSEDAFAFDGPAGQRVRLRLDAEGMAQGALYAPGSTAWSPEFGAVPNHQERAFLLPVSGPWLFAVRGSASPGQPVGQRYAFSLALEEPRTAFHAAPAEGWASYEFAWSAPARVLVEARLAAPEVAGAPAAAMVVVSGDLQPAPGPFRYALFVSGGGLGGAVRAGPVEGTMPPGLALAVEAMESGGAVILGQGAEGAPTTGWARVVLLHTAPARAEFSFSLDGPARAASATGEGLLDWRDGDAAALLAAPGVSAAGARDLTVDGPGALFGLFGPQAARGTISGPGSEDHALGPYDQAFLFGPGGGPWRLRMGPAAGAVGATPATYLLAAQVPLLGVAGSGGGVAVRAFPVSVGPGGAAAE